MYVRLPAVARRRWWPVPLAALSSLLVAVVVLQPRVGASGGFLPAAPAANRCARPVPSTAAGFQRMFDGLDGDWAGGDQAATVPLPGGRTLWLFGDTVAGYRIASGGYSPGWTLRHNSFLVEDGGCLRPVPTGLPETADAWYWPAAGVVDGGRLVVFAMRVERAGSAPGVAETVSGPDFRVAGGALAQYRLAADGTPTLESMRALPNAPQSGPDPTLWGQGALADGDRVYVYGTRADTAHGAFGRALLVARAPAGAVADPAAWRYFDGHRFVADAARAEPVVAAVRGVSTSVSAVRTAHGFAVVAKQDEVFGTDVTAWTAPTPTGPFTATALFPAPSTGDLLRYSALAHPEFRLAGGRLLVSVCRNSTDLAAVGDDALLYRPQFTAVRLPGSS
jgi:hypothetical protein